MLLFWGWEVLEEVKSAGDEGLEEVWRHLG